MGIEYTLANHKNKTAFELGKGSWYALMDENRKGAACLLYEKDIYNIIVNEVWDLNDANEEASSWKEYAKEIAAKIFQFVGDADPSEISLHNDCDDSNFELREQNYQWVGSRYR